MFRKFLLAVCLMAPLPAMAAGLTASNAWIRLLPAGLPLGGYFKLHNSGKQVIILAGVSSPAFRQIQMHKSVEKNGVESMQRVHTLKIMPGRSISFAPGGYHLMLFGRTHPLKIGEKVPVTLRFSGKRPAMRIFFTVKGATGE